MVGERTIQLRLVRPIFRALPFLAPLAGQAASEFQIEIAYRIFSRPWDGDCCALLLLPVRLFEIANPEWRLLSLDPRFGSRYVDAFASLVGRRKSVAPPFCISRRVYFRCGAVANSSGSSRHSGADAHRRARRRRNSDAARNSRASRR